MTRHSLDQTVRSLSGVDWNFHRYVPQRSTSIHNVHSYPAVFFRGLIGTLLDILEPLRHEGLFLDPFAGSGVAPIEAWMRGWHSLGVDSNSYAVAIAAAKVELLARARSSEHTPIELCHSLETAGPRGSVADLPAETDITEALRFFSPGSLESILRILAWIREPVEPGQSWREVLRVILSSILHRPLSLYRDVNHSYIIDRSRAPAPRSPEVNAFDVMSRAISSSFAAGWAGAEESSRREVNLSNRPTICRADARDLDQLGAPPWTLSITSPPYFGMNDYVRSNYLTSLVDPRGEFASEVRAELGPRRLRTSVVELESYLAGLSATFAAMRTFADPAAVLVVVMGQSSSRLATASGVQKRSLAAIADSGYELVWSTTRRVKFRKINSTPYRSEDIWVFRTV